MHRGWSFIISLPVESEILSQELGWLNDGHGEHQQKHLRLFGQKHNGPQGTRCSCSTENECSLWEYKFTNMQLCWSEIIVSAFVRFTLWQNFEIDLSISFWRPSIRAGNLCTLFLVLYANPWPVMMLYIGTSDLDTALRAGDFCAAVGRNVWDKYIFKVTLFILVLHTSTVALSLSLNTVKFSRFLFKFFGQVTHPFLILVFGSVKWIPCVGDFSVLLKHENATFY